MKRLVTKAESRSNPGFTLVELMISVSIISVLFYATTTIAISASATYDQTIRRSQLVSRAHIILDQIADEFVEAELGDLSPAGLGVGASTITYHVPDSVVGGVIVWSADRSITFQVVDGEFNDGIDNNGDGRIDEGRIVQTLDIGLASQRQVTLCNNVRSLLGGELGNFADDNGNGMVDERGLVFELNVNILTIRLTLEVLDGNSGVLTKTIQTSVRVRN